jgi:excisionase family DNA binding protein
MRGWAKPKQIAKYMDLSERTVRSLLKKGLPHIRMPTGTTLVKYSEVDEYLKQFEVTQDNTDKIVDEVLADF